MNVQKLLSEYHKGLGFKYGDVLKPKMNSNPFTYGVVNSEVVVLSQNCLVPHQYEVLGEKEKPERPSDKFIKFNINGHDWERVED